jgi:ESCRT-II complex subunit VPS22
MRRGVGVGALKKTQERHSQIALQGAKLEEKDEAAMKEQIAVFKTKLEQFARHHAKKINEDPILRKRFHEMCTSIGVDPLSSQKGFWAQILGVGDFYYELGVQIIDVCLRTRQKNGGYIELSLLLGHLNSRRAADMHRISEDDIERAISKLLVLGSGFQLAVLGDLRIVQSVPLELSEDQSVVLRLASASSQRWVDAARLHQAHGWSAVRCAQTLEALEHAGLAWIDDGDSSGRRWFFPSLHEELI